MDRLISESSPVCLDVLTCGRCGEDFSLSHLAAFLSHKSAGCKPNQTQLFPPKNPRQSPENARRSPAESARVSPDSRGSPPATRGSPTPSKVESSRPDSWSSRKQGVDAATNTSTGTHTFRHQKSKVSNWSQWCRTARYWNYIFNRY